MKCSPKLVYISELCVSLVVVSQQISLTFACIAFYADWGKGFDLGDSRQSTVGSEIAAYSGIAV